MSKYSDYLQVEHLILSCPEAWRPVDIVRFAGENLKQFIFVAEYLGVVLSGLRLLGKSSSEGYAIPQPKRGIDMKLANMPQLPTSVMKLIMQTRLGSIGDENRRNILHCSSVLGLGPRFLGVASGSGQVHSTPLLRHLSHFGFFSSHYRMLLTI